MEDSDSFAPETVPANFPTNYDAVKIFSFSDYVTALQAERICQEVEPIPYVSRPGATTDFVISGIAFKGYNWQVPFVQCDSNLCSEDGQDAVPFCNYLSLGLAPSSASDQVGMDQAMDFANYVYDRYPQLRNKTQLPFDHDFILLFASDDDVETYVTSEYYEEAEKPKLALSVIFDGTDPTANFTYKIRVNSTGFNAPEDSARPGFATTPPTDKKFEHYAKNDNSTCPIFDGTPEFGPYQSSCTGKYIYNGFLTTQRLVHDYIIDRSGAEAKGYFVSEHGVQYAPFPSFEYIENGFYEAIAGTNSTEKRDEFRITVNLTCLCVVRFYCTSLYHAGTSLPSSCNGSLHCS